MDIIEGQVVIFKRPNSDKLEFGLYVGYEDHHLIIDQDLNVVINCSIEQYMGEETRFILN